MKHSEEEILEALHVIKDVCKDNGDNCRVCPLGSDIQCKVTDSIPELWMILEKIEHRQLLL